MKKKLRKNTNVASNSIRSYIRDSACGCNVTNCGATSNSVQMTVHTIN